MGKNKPINKKPIKGKKGKSEQEEKIDSEYGQDHSVSEH